MSVEAVDLGAAQVLRAGYVEAMSGLAGGVTIVTALHGRGRPAGMTTTSAVSVSADPPLVSVSLGTGSRTLRAISASGEFCVNIVRPSGRRAAQAFASKSDDKFRDVAWEPGPGGVPWLPALSSHALHCEVVEEVSAGDHVLLLGRVHSVDTGRSLGEPDQGLVYWRRQWRELT